MSEKELCWSSDEERFSNTSLGDLLDENDELAPGSIVYVGEMERPEVSYLCGADDVLDTVAERAYDVGGDYAEDCAHVSDEAKSELNAFLGDWIRKHCSLNFWQVKNVRPYVLTEADFAAVPANQEQ